MVRDLSLPFLSFVNAKIGKNFCCILLISFKNVLYQNHTGMIILHHILLHASKIFDVFL